MHHSNEHTTALGTAAGATLTFIANVGTEDIVKTIILSCIGAVVSFVVSTLLKWVIKKIKNG